MVGILQKGHLGQTGNSPRSTLKPSVFWKNEAQPNFQWEQLPGGSENTVVQKYTQGQLSTAKRLSVIA